MVNHRDQAKHDRAGWRLIVLAPAWMAQISLLIILIGTGSYMLSVAAKQSVEVRGTVIAWEVVNIIVGALSFLLTAYEIFRMATESLTPKLLVVGNTIKLFGIILGMIMDGMATGTSVNSWADGTFVIHAILVVSVLVPTCYAAWKWKRLAQYDDYHHPGNVKPFGFKSDLKLKSYSHSRAISDDLDWDPELGHTVEISSPGIMAVSPGEPSPDVTGSRSRGSSFTKLAGKMNFSLTNNADAVSNNGNRSRSSTGASLNDIETAYDPASTQISETEGTLPQRPRAASYISITGTGADRRASYNHTRDTAFDDYVAQNKDKKRASQRISSASTVSHGSSPSTSSSASSRHSMSASASPYRVSLGLSLKNDLDDAISAEFGWGSSSRASSQDSEMVSGQPPAIAVAGGAVQGAKNVRDSLGRAPSNFSERGAMGNVPEEDEADEGDRRQKNVDEASRALLGEADIDEVSHPSSLRPHRPISVVITPPPKSPTGDRNPRMTWGSAYSRS